VSAATFSSPYFVPITYEYLVLPVHVRRERFVTRRTVFSFECFAQLKLNSQRVTVAFSYAFSFPFISLFLPIFPVLPSCLRLAFTYIYLICVCLICYFSLPPYYLFYPCVQCSVHSVGAHTLQHNAVSQWGEGLPLAAIYTMPGALSNLLYVWTRGATSARIRTLTFVHFRRL